MSRRRPARIESKRIHAIARQAALLAFLGCAWPTDSSFAQIPSKEESRSTARDAERVSDAPDKVEVQPLAHDRQIRDRLQSILEATEWFETPRVEVEDGVVFLDGQTQTADLKLWAGDLARSTQDVAAVVNRIGVTQLSAWDFRLAREGLHSLWRDFAYSLPFVVFGLLILALSAGGGLLATRTAHAFLQRRIHAQLLRTVVSRAAGAFVFLAGVYVVLRIAGLTQLALTIVGGTGLIGLAVGIAFRDITENFLASIFLSIQRPFETGDLVEIVGVTGFVQQLNVRTTVLMNLDGNLVQVPNATVYKSTLRNFSVNPKRRESFSVGIGYCDPIDKAQEVARAVLAEHPAVLDDPEPWVLADQFGSSSIQLRIYFWLDGRQHSWLKVRSSVIRLVKIAFQNNGISMPDEAREVVFPQGVPVTMPGDDAAGQARTSAQAAAPPQEPSEVSTKAEAGLESEAEALEKQAREAKPTDPTENLLARGSGRQRAA